MVRLFCINLWIQVLDCVLSFLSHVDFHECNISSLNAFVNDLVIHFYGFGLRNQDRCFSGITFLLAVHVLVMVCTTGFFSWMI